MISFTGYSILIVDDDSDLREILAEEFIIYGAMVETAANGSEALAKILANNYDIILSDMRMPKGDGRFLAKEVMNLNKEKAPLFFLYSGYNDIGPAEAKALGILEIFNKPLDGKSMFVSISKWAIAL